MSVDVSSPGEWSVIRDGESEVGITGSITGGVTRGEAHDEAETMSVNYELVEDDIAAMCAMAPARQYRRSPWAIALGTIILVSAGLTCAGGCLSASVGGGSEGIVVAVVLGATAAVLLAISSPRDRSARKQCQAVIRRGYGRLSLREHTVTIAPDRFVSSNDLSELTTRWMGIFAIRINEQHTHAFVFTSPSAAVIIPARAFDSAPAFIRFVHLMRTWRSRSPGVESRCPRCDYDLRRNDVIGCPECGWGRGD